MKYLKVWTDLHNSLKPFSDAEKGRLFDAMMKYAEDGAEPDLRGNERFIWEMVRAEIDRQRTAYEKQCAVNKANITSRYEPLRIVASGNESKQEHKTEDKTEDKERKRKVFTPPTREEVKAYCRERHNTVNADRWYDFYESKNWMVGKNKMVNWQACVRTWEDSKAYQDGEPKKSKYANVPIS